ncbi:MAG: WHG domain-containing protein [Ottowia sp.]|uniref:TetR/AcrR family transcriptional regulator n=1 Tax=Ottowia sp. TaxID=1898956 RepID=UPI003C78EF46
MIRQKASEHSSTQDLKRASTKKGLGRQQVLEAARVLSNAQGIEGLSVRALADHLGIRPPSVYAHIGGLDEIKRALALWGHQALAETLRDSAVGLSGPAALFEMCTAYLRFVRTEPGLYSATVPTPQPEDVPLRQAADQWLAVFYKVFAGLSLDEEAQIHALRGLRSIVHGFGTLEASGAFRTKYDRDLSFRTVLTTFIQAVADASPAHAGAPLQHGKP